MIRPLSVVVISGLVLTLAFSVASADPNFGISKDWGGWLLLNACQDSRSFTLFNEGDGVLVWEITVDQDWLTVEPSSGSNPPGIAYGTVVTISVDRTGLDPGRYTGNLYITGNAPNTHEGMWMDVQQTPKLTIDPLVVGFSLERPDKAVKIQNTGREALDWVVTSHPSWIDISSPISGTLECETQTQLSIHLEPSGLPSQDEEHTGDIIVDSNGGTVPVSVYYYPEGQTGGLIGIFTDPAGANCNILYDGPGLVSVYVVHTRSVGAVASQFSAPIPACWTNAAWLSDTGLWPINIGNSQTGVAIGYGTCLESPIHPLTINYFVQGPPTEACCYYPVLPDPHVSSGEIEVVDCNNDLVYAEGGVAVLYPTANCMCEGGVVAVEETTWGRVKALYAPDAK